MSNTRKARPYMPDWGARKAQPITVKHRFARGSRQYNELSDGSFRRLESDRMDRRELGVSPRQYRKAKRAAREAAL